MADTGRNLPSLTGLNKLDRKVSIFGFLGKNGIYSNFKRSQNQFYLNGFQLF